MTKDDAERIIKAILKGEKLLERRAHFWARTEHRPFTVQDVDRILRRHVLADEPRRDETHGNHEVRLDGRTLDGAQVRIVLGLREVGPCSLITIFDRKPPKRR